MRINLNFIAAREQKHNLHVKCHEIKPQNKVYLLENVTIKPQKFLDFELQDEFQLP